jgi:hypothetical protein
MIASAMNILFEEFLKLKIEEPFGIFFGHLCRAKWHARAFSSLNRSPAGLKIQYRRTGDSLCSVQFCNYFETFQCMLIF